MKVAEYQQKAVATLKPNMSFEEVLGLCGLGLSGEKGEIIDLVKKYLYHENGKELNVEKIKDELGDLMWYIAVLCTALDFNLEEIAKLRASSNNPLVRELVFNRVLQLISLYITVDVGKIASCLIDYLYYGKKFVNVKELGFQLRDLIFNITIICELLCFKLDEVLEVNIQKLAKRHSSGYNAQYDSDSKASI